ncbi:MAG: hypothetical protein ACLTQI_00095 [Slackia sp.]
MTPEQLTDEIVGVANLITSVYDNFGFTYHVELSTRPEDSMGSDEDWEAAEQSLKTLSTSSAWIMSSMKATVLSTARRSTFIWKTPWAARGNAALCSLTSRCR